MSEKSEFNLKTDSQVALELFNNFIALQDESKRKEIFKDSDSYIELFAKFAKITRNPYYKESK